MKVHCHQYIKVHLCYTLPVLLNSVYGHYALDVHTSCHCIVSYCELVLVLFGTSSIIWYWTRGCDGLWLEY